MNIEVIDLVNTPEYARLERLIGMHRENAHKTFTPDQLYDTVHYLSQLVESQCLWLTPRILKHYTRGLVWCATTSNTRFIVPSSYERTGKPLGWRFRGHPVHINSLYGLPVNNKNIWIPLTDVGEDNTLIVHDGKISTKLVGKAGTAFIFDSDLPHETVENLTDKTRVTVTLRFCTSRPHFRTKERVMKYAPRWI